MCGSNNCQKFGSYFHPKDDCCDVAASIATATPPVVVPGAPQEPSSGRVQAEECEDSQPLYVQVRGVVAVTIHLAGDAAPQRILVEREKVIVMELVMEVIMMETKAVKQA